MQWDSLRRDVEARGEMRAFDEFAGQASTMLTKGKARRAFEPDEEKPKRRPLSAWRDRFMLFAFFTPVTWDWDRSSGRGGWWKPACPLSHCRWAVDHHCAEGLPTLFEIVTAPLLPLTTTASRRSSRLVRACLHESVCVVVWGEFRAHAADQQIRRTDHWPAAGSVLFSGGGLKMGQYVGATNSSASTPSAVPTLRRIVLGRSTMFSGLILRQQFRPHGRPQFLLDDRIRSKTDLTKSIPDELDETFTFPRRKTL